MMNLAAAYFLGTFGKAEGWVQAFGAGQRNIAAAMVVATMNFGNDEVVMVVAYSLITLLVMVPLALEQGKRRTVAPGQEEESQPDLEPT